MDTEKRKQLDMQLTLRNCVAQNEEVAKKIPKFWDNYVIVQSTTDEIQEISKAQGSNKTGISSDKNKLKMNLIALAAKNSRKIAAYAKFINSDTLLKEIKYNEGQLERLAEASFKNHFGRYHSDPRIPLEKAIQVYVEWMRSCIRGYADFILVAEIDKRIAGVSTWKKASILEKDLSLRISHYNIGAVHPDFSGMGLFSNLTYAGMQIFKDSADIIEGPTHVNNYPVQRGYQRLGWQVFDARHSFHKWLDK